MKVISLINMKGGVGKTTLATNLCDCLSKRNQKKVLLIDIDPQFNSTQCLFSGDEYVEYLSKDNDTIINIFDDTIKTVTSTVDGVSQISSRELKDIKPYKFKENFYILPGNLELYKLNMPSGSGRENRLKRYLQQINAVENFDYVFIDTPPTPSVWMTSALLASDYYLIPVKPDPISFVGIDLLENIINSKRDDYDLEIKCIGIVFTMIEREDSIVYKKALEKVEGGRWKNYKFVKYIPKRADIAKLQLNKQFILDMNDGEAMSALTGIVSELENRIENESK
jgi:chromosome partitioning protein